MNKKKTKLVIEIVLFIIALLGITFIYYFNGNKEISEEEQNEVGIIKITNENFESEILQSDKPVVLEFYSNMCPPCLTMLPTMINLAKNHQELKVATVNNSDENTSEIAKQYEVEATPTIIIIKDGKVHHRIIGATNEEGIMEALK